MGEEMYHLNKDKNLAMDILYFPPSLKLVKGETVHWFGEKRLLPRIRAIESGSNSLIVRCITVDFKMSDN